MANQELVDGLVATYRTLNMTVRPQPEATLRGKGGAESSVREVIRRLRDDELRFSQALKVRVSTGQAMPDPATEELGVIGTETADDSTAALLAQFGTARESTLAMLRGMADAEWDSAAGGGQTIRTSITGLLANDRRRLDAIDGILGTR